MTVTVKDARRVLGEHEMREAMRRAAAAADDDDDDDGDACNACSPISTRFRLLQTCCTQYCTSCRAKSEQFVGLQVSEVNSTFFKTQTKFLFCVL